MDRIKCKTVSAQWDIKISAVSIDCAQWGIKISAVSIVWIKAAILKHQAEHEYCNISLSIIMVHTVKLKGSCNCTVEVS